MCLSVCVCTYVTVFVYSLYHEIFHVFRYTGMLETVRVRREGFAYRPFFSDFVTDYRQIAFKFTDKVMILKIKLLKCYSLLIFYRVFVHLKRLVRKFLLKVA